MKPPAGTHQTEPQPLDNIQILLQRRAELQRNKAKYALTETDAKLMMTHSTELQFEDGQTIVEEGLDITNVYRIRAGKAVVSRHGFQFNIIERGWFIGDPMLIYDTPAYTMKCSIKAQGHVIIDQLNLPFVRELFSVDATLKARFMRHLVSKYSFFFTSIVSDLENPAIRGMHKAESSACLENTATLLTAAISHSDLSSEDSSSSLNSEDLSSGASTPTSSSGPTSSSSGSSTPTSAPVTPIFSESASRLTPQHHHHHLRHHRAARQREHAPYKSYPLANRGGIQTLHLKTNKMKVVSKSFGFSFKTTIEFSKIQSINKIGENAATIVYQPRKVANVFFKNYFDREEFFGLVNSLITHTPSSPSIVEPRTPGQSLTVAHNPDLTYDEVPLCGGKEHLCKSHQTMLALKKGDKLFEEGDLFQRVYTVLRGHCNIYQKGKLVCTMEEGDLYGMASLLLLRPCPVTVEVASETADIVYIPAYKLNQMLETDTLQASELYQHAAIALDRQISRAVGYLPNCKRILRERSERESLRERSDSGSSLHSESSFSSMRERSDSTTSEGLSEGLPVEDQKVVA